MFLYKQQVKKNKQCKKGYFNDNICNESGIYKIKCIDCDKFYIRQIEFLPGLFLERQGTFLPHVYHQIIIQINQNYNICNIII